MKRICKGIVFILAVLCFSILPVFSTNRLVVAEDNVKVFDASSGIKNSSSAVSNGTPKIYLEAEKTDKNGVAQPKDGARYKVGFYIKATSEVSNVKVSWRTRDMTAIASEGEYDSKDTTYTLNGTSSPLIYINIYNKGVATRVDRKLARLQVNNDLTSDESITRKFFIEITDISCDMNMAVIDNSKKQLIASAGSEYTFSVTKIFDEKNSNNYMSYFSSYAFIKDSVYASYTPRNQRINNAIYLDKSPNIQDGKKYYSDAVYSSTTVFNEFINRGYADLYATIMADTYEDKTIGSSDNIRVSIVYADNHEYICQYDIEYGGWSSEHTYDMLQMQTSSRYTTNPGKVLVGDTITRHYYDGRYYYYYKEEYWQVKDPNRRIQVEFWDYDDYEGRYFYDVKVNTVIADTKAPEIVGYYLQQEPLKQGDKLGLTVRFTEPVQLIGNKRKPIISARINNSNYYEYANFEYVSGSGTDTLYFEWTPTDRNINITSLTLCDFLNASSIADYSLSANVVQNPQIFRSDDTDSFKGDSSKFTYFEPEVMFDDKTQTWTDGFMSHNQLSKPTLNKTISTKLDLRIPDVSADIKSDDMKASKYIEVPIKIKDLASDGKLYYSWTTSNLKPDVYDNVATNLGDVYIIRASDMNGKYHLHIVAVSAYGRKQELSLGSFLFDDNPPEINVSPEKESLAERTFSLEIVDGGDSTEWASGVTDVSLSVATDPKGENIVKKYEYDGKEAKTFKQKVIVSATDLGLGKNEYGTFYIFVTAYDKLGNKAQTEITKYKFDTRTFIDVKYENAMFNEIDKTLDISTDNYKVIDITDGVWLKFTTSDTTGSLTSFVLKNANNETFEIDRYNFSVTSKEIYIESDLAPGYYTISFSTEESGTTKYSQEIVLYFTKNLQDEDLGIYSKISNGLLFTNSVYQLNNDLTYYYMDKDGNIQTSRYGNSSKSATFSSRYEAIKYLKFMEYQDLYPIKINSTQADLLNGKSSPNFLKANGETMVAEAGQIWIRYKTTGFDKDPTTSQWAYYYYQGETLTLRQEYFSMNLLSSISTVAERLAKNYGSSVILIGEGNVNKYNEPYLEKDQIHNSFESVSQTKCGISFDKAIFYDGDAQIYNSKIDESGISYDIATNLEFSSNGFNRLFYKGKDNSVYTEIDLTKYTNISQVITASGIYDLIELDKKGVRKFSVYIDKDAPILTGFMQDTEGNIITKEFSKSSQGITYTTKSFAFGPFLDIEKDEFCYVSVWKYLTNKTGELLKVYLRNDLSSNSYILENGEYHIEVYDRSGNGYSFVICVNSQNFICETTEKADEYIMVTCNREENQIQTYEIYLNGELLTSKYSQRQRFDQSGVYSIYILDIFNNEYRYEIDFKRTYPTVNWQYYDKALDGYVSYNDGISKKMQITRINETTFKIVASSLLQFKYNSLYKYEFVGNVDYSENGISHIVKINTLQPFEVKISYLDYNETSITYICEIDDQAPSISVKIEKEIFKFDEIEYFNEQLKNGNVGDELKYNTIKYSKRDTQNLYLTSGDIVQSRILKVSASDNFGISLIRIYLNGILLIEETQNFSDIVLSRFGEYKIEAYDDFENKSEFTFTNNIQEYLKYNVDGVEKESNESTLKYFENGVFTKVDYGKDYVELLLKANCSLSFKIEGNEVIYSSLEIIDGKIYFVTYKIAQDGEDKVISTEKSSAIFDISQGDMVANDWYLILGKNQCGKNIYAKFDSDGNISIKIENDSEQSCIIEGRIRFSNVEPFYFKAELSQEQSDVVVKNSDNNVIGTNKDGNQIKINKAFHIDQASVSNKIKSIKVYFSLNNNFDEYVLVFDGTNFTANEFSQNGLYLVEIQNIYGNITRYYILKSENFMATVSTELADGKEFNYSEKYNGQVFSNKYVFINAYSGNVTYEILRNNQIYSGAIVTVENGITVVKLFEKGEYNIKITDEFGNVFVSEAEINQKNLDFDEDLIYGYNENALRKDDGYTNKILSISKAKLTDNNICYISIIFNDKETVLLDLISEKITNLESDEILNSCIGKDGDGEYIIIFRDKFGNKMPEKTIHYKKGTTLSLSRTIRSSNETQNYEISEAIEKGFWANNSLIFNTTSSQYIFKIDGRKVDCPRTLNFGSGADEGDFVYKVSYQDEYGNFYEFEAHLFRQKLELLVPSKVKTIDEDGLLITRNNISLVVPDNAICTYLLNGEEKEYISNTVLTKDGNYRFTIKDLAGNISALTIKKDTVVEFDMTEVSTNSKVVNGGIICSDRVAFNALNGDSSYIKYVFKNGELIKDFDDNKFIGNGKWEIIISDNIGNETYFTFQIIMHKLNKFDYTVPYGYKITEIWFNAGDDIPLSYMQYVKGEGTILNLTENGKYSVVMSSDTTGLSSSFSIEINNSKPQIKLVGCNEDETTLNDITITGFKVGDKIEIYRDGKLYKTVEILTSQTDAPIITEGGNYRIVVTNEAGVETTVSFVRKYIPNSAGNVLIIVLIIIAALVVFIGLVYRQRSKVDE